jgi:hypothetical protein
MNFQSNYRKLDELPPDVLVRIQDAVDNALDSEWDFKKRQQYPAHKDTAAIILCFGPNNDLEAAKYTPHWARWKPLLGSLLDKITKRHFGDGGKIIRLMIVRLFPHSRVNSHFDDVPVLKRSHRIHIPLRTNPSVVFVVGNEVVPMPEGQIIEINNQRFHSVVNSGEADRIHLIFDYAPASELAKSIRR